MMGRSATAGLGGGENLVGGGGELGDGGEDLASGELDGGGENLASGGKLDGDGGMQASAGVLSGERPREKSAELTLTAEPQPMMPPRTRAGRAATMIPA